MVGRQYSLRSVLQLEGKSSHVYDVFYLLQDSAYHRAAVCLCFQSNVVHSSA
jgi:hypothetical protein